MAYKKKKYEVLILFTSGFVFVSSSAQVPNGCNMYIESPSGTLSSPELPESAVYNNNTDCVWTIVNKADKIQMSVTTVLKNSTLNPSLNTLQVYGKWMFLIVLYRLTAHVRQ